MLLLLKHFFIINNNQAIILSAEEPPSPPHNWFMSSEFGADGIQGVIWRLLFRQNVLPPGGVSVCVSMKNATIKSHLHANERSTNCWIIDTIPSIAL